PLPTPYSPLPNYHASTLHNTDVLDRDGAAIPEESDDDRQADGGLARRDRQHEQGEDLADEITHVRRERHQVHVAGGQHQLDRHQDDDHVLAVDEDAEDAEREQDRRDGEIVPESDRHAPSFLRRPAKSPTAAQWQSRQ